MSDEVLFVGEKGIIKYYNKNALVKIDTVFTREEIEASYPGGEEMWMKYVQNKIVQNGDALIKDGKTGTCRIKFIVDKEGQIKSVEVLTMAGSVLADVATSAIKNSKKWNPAKQYGRPVNAYREQPFAFTIRER